MFNAIRRNPLVAYVIMTYIISWAVWSPLVATAQGWVDWNVPGALYYFGPYGPLLSAVIVSAITRGGPGLRDLLRRIHIASLGMFEHAAYKNYHTYMQVVHDHLKDVGLFLLHTIGQNVSYKATDPWFGKYIFPNSLIPSTAQIAKAVEKLFVIKDWHDFGPDYTPTLRAWFSNFQAHWETLRPKYGDRFYRMWKYYLMASAAAFRTRRNNVWQIVLSKSGVPGGYECVR